MTATAIIVEIAIGLALIVVGFFLQNPLKRFREILKSPGPATPQSRGQWTTYLGQLEQSLERVNYLNSHPARFVYLSLATRPGLSGIRRNGVHPVHLGLCKSLNPAPRTVACSHQGPRCHRNCPGLPWPRRREESLAKADRCDSRQAAEAKSINTRSCFRNPNRKAENRSAPLGVFASATTISFRPAKAMLIKSPRPRSFLVESVKKRCRSFDSSSLKRDSLRMTVLSEKGMTTLVLAIKAVRAGCWVRGWGAGSNGTATADPSARPAARDSLRMTPIISTNH